jgi:hypothetical protein
MRIRITTVFLAIAMTGGLAGAQATTGAGTSTSKYGPVRDSLKNVHADLQQAIADRKAAKAAGDKTKVRAETQIIQDDRKLATTLRARLPKPKKRSSTAAPPAPPAKSP